MDMYSASSLGYDINVAPRYSNFPYEQWCCRFKIFVESRNIDLRKVIDNAYIVPTSEKSKWSKHDKKIFTMNKLVLEFMHNAFGPCISNELAHFDSAYAI